MYVLGLGLFPDEQIGGHCVNPHYLHVAIVRDCY